MHSDVSNSDGWQPIETAPRASWGNLIDLWVVIIQRGEIRGYRETNCRCASCDPTVWISGEGRYLTYVAYYDDEGDECLAVGAQPLPAGHKDAIGPNARTRSGLRIVTHWMKPPAAPASFEGDKERLLRQWNDDSLWNGVPVYTPRYRSR